jgi:uncharacterized membrane protein
VNAYTFLKFLHVLSVVFWIGGAAGLAFVGWRVAKERNRVLLTALLEQGMAYGQRVIAPSAGIVLLSGLALVGIGHIGFGTFWVWFGYGGVLVQFILGGFVIQKRAGELKQLAAAPSGDDVALVAAARRLWNTQIVYLILFAVVIAAMVIKPTF